jgi:regulator of cell morphogenesis and NO signaling
MNEIIAIYSQTKLGELVTYFPAIASRLNELHIDYCCQGERTLEAAIEAAEITSDFITEIHRMDITNF